jgi:hypothetical protein
MLSELVRECEADGSFCNIMALPRRFSVDFDENYLNRTLKISKGLGTFMFMAT